MSQAPTPYVANTIPTGKHKYTPPRRDKYPYLCDLDPNRKVLYKTNQAAE